MLLSGPLVFLALIFLFIFRSHFVDIEFRYWLSRKPCYSVQLMYICKGIQVAKEMYLDLHCLYRELLYDSVFLSGKLSGRFLEFINITVCFFPPYIVCKGVQLCSCSTVFKVILCFLCWWVTIGGYTFFGLVSVLSNLTGARAQTMLLRLLRYPLILLYRLLITAFSAQLIRAFIAKWRAFPTRKATSSFIHWNRSAGWGGK